MDLLPFLKTSATEFPALLTWSCYGYGTVTHFISFQLMGSNYSNTHLGSDHHYFFALSMKKALVKRYFIS
jgi:hypothetical protein